MKTKMILIPLLLALTVAHPLSSARADDKDSQQAVIKACSQNKAYLTWKSRCQGTAQAACYCAAAALIRCYMKAAPTNPNIDSWKQAYDANLQNASNLGTTCFNN